MKMTGRRPLRAAGPRAARGGNPAQAQVEPATAAAAAAPAPAPAAPPAQEEPLFVPPSGEGVSTPVVPKVSDPLPPSLVLGLISCNRESVRRRLLPRPPSPLPLPRSPLLLLLLLARIPRQRLPLGRPLPLRESA